MKHEISLLRRGKSKFKNLQNKHLWFVSIFLYLSVFCLNLYLLYRNELGHSYKITYPFFELFTLNVGLILLPIGSCILGLFLENIFKASLNLGKIKYILLTLITSLILYSISPVCYTFKSRIKYNYCTEISSENIVTYETDEIIITFEKAAISQKIEQRLKMYYKDTSSYRNYKNEINLKQLIENSKKESLHIKHFFEYLPDTFRIYPSYQKNKPNDSIPILDEESLLNDYSLAMSFLILGILEEDDIMVYNKNEKKFEDYISYKYWSMYPLGIGTSGKVYYYSNDSVFYDIVLTWGF